MMEANPPLLLKLFVTTYAQSSTRAIRNLTALMEECFPQNYQLEIIDIKKQPLLVLSENIIAVPLLVKTAPEPYKRMIGDMSDRLKVLAGLQMPAN
jgi:circadian clock protein KaiB